MITPPRFNIPLAAATASSRFSLLSRILHFILLFAGIRGIAQFPSQQLRQPQQSRNALRQFPSLSQAPAQFPPPCEAEYICRITSTLFPEEFQARYLKFLLRVPVELANQIREQERPPAHCILTHLPSLYRLHHK